MNSNFSQLSTDALSPGQLPESVKALLKRAKINRFPKRTTIIDAGTESKSLYLILKGSVSIVLREDDDREIVVAYLNPGDFFGEMGLFEANPQRTAEVVGRVLKTLEEQGMIETEGKAILIFDSSLEQNNESSASDFDTEDEE